MDRIVRIRKMKKLRLQGSTEKRRQRSRIRERENAFEVPLQAWDLRILVWAHHRGFKLKKRARDHARPRRNRPVVAQQAKRNVNISRAPDFAAQVSVRGMHGNTACGEPIPQIDPGGLDVRPVLAIYLVLEQRVPREMVGEGINQNNEIMTHFTVQSAVGAGPADGPRQARVRT